MHYLANMQSTAVAFQGFASGGVHVGLTYHLSDGFIDVCSNRRNDIQSLCKRQKREKLSKVFSRQMILCFPHIKQTHFH